MTDKDFYDRIDKARSLFTSREAVTRYCHEIRMLEDIYFLENINAANATSKFPKFNWSIWFTA